MKRLLSFILAVVFVCGIIVYAVAAPYTGVIDAKSVLLINMDTGEVLHSSNPTDKVYPAGTTKLMTALVAYELCEDLDEPFVIADEALADITEGTDKTLAPMLRPGETVTMRDILGGVLVGSGNDAAAVAAYHSAGSVPDFIAKMNEKAEKLGMTGTHFTNPHGRSGDEHYTTATDMGKLMTQIYKIPALMGILNQKSVTIAGSDTTTERVITSVNLFYTGNDVQKYSLGTGSLGGYLDIAGGCLVSGAEKDGVRLLCMIFEEPTVDGSWVAAKSLFEYAFIIAF